MKIFVFLVTALILTPGCQVAPGVAELKVMLSEAASMSNQVMIEHSISGGILRWQDMEDQPLTAIVITTPMPKVRSEAAEKELHSLWSEPTFLMHNPPSEDRWWLFVPRNITAIERRVRGDTITGKITFRVPDMLEGSTEYVVRRFSDGWRVVEFRMPANGIRTILTPVGVWRAFQ